MKTIQIPISRKVQILTLLGSTLFIYIGIIFTLNPEKYISTFFRHPFILRLIGISTIIVFGTFLIGGAYIYI